MFKKVSVFIIVSFALLLSACGSSGSSSEENASNYPENQIEVIVPFSSGGASDLVSRTVASEMENDLDVPLTITNQTGGSGATGMLSLKNAQADGYTIGYVPVEMSMLDSLELADITPSDYEFIGQLMTIPSAITVPADAPYDTIEEFVSYAEENPGEIQIGNSGTGSIWHIAAAAFAEEAGIDVEYVPYDGASPAVTALMGGHISAVSVSPSEVRGGVESGDLKVLGVMGEERDPELPDVPTMQEAGYDVSVAGWGGFVAPEGTPEEVLEPLRSSFKNAAESEEFQQLMDDRGMIPAYKNGKEFSSYAEEQYDYFSELIPTIEINQ
ncbi:tripartite tricarboxylate transporter substrate binding protein [Salibacterium qingdaonense]|uniref:Tripartite-type tricarboxylate transporter, receptor component TctC n=1 Tax=Salibacterium qingdaonense TaxID=266892 RepID=A0A1I4PL96_9BACI|nr:tripartite tricarboxylate transporter substrate binding protein [Salibacterium qingdaonense]SFM28599.1 Tripartite-type tricarboxylate transporter, receptor component TctC [Salibacterium qingdaonense]